MKQQTAQITILASALVGALVTIQREGAEPQQLLAGHDALQHLKPGDKVTIEVASDERWVEAQKQAEAKAAEAAKPDDVDHGKLADLDKAARDDIAANPAAGPDLSGKADVEPSPGNVTSDTGATRTRSTGKGASA